MFSKIYFLCCFWLFAATASAQLTDDFSDGNFSENPAWKGDTASFIVNAAGQLQSNDFTTGNLFFLSTSNQLAEETEWKFFVKTGFNPSSANFVDVWLAASVDDLKSAINKGYFLRIGSTDDDICLFKKDERGKVSKLIDGENGVINRSSSSMIIRVIRTNNRFILLRDLSGTGINFICEGTASDDEITATEYFGLLIKQSTSSFFQKHFFDDFLIKEFAPPAIPFAVTNLLAIDANTLQISFSEILNGDAHLQPDNYFSDPSGPAETVLSHETDGKIVTVRFKNKFESDKTNSLIIKKAINIFGTQLNDIHLQFDYYKPKRYDVIMNEVFADVQPAIGLPVQKFIELKNISGHDINLKNWTISDGTIQSILPEYMLNADSFLIICPASGLDAYKTFGAAISMSPFPSMLVGGGTIILYNNEGAVMHAMSYDLSTYGDDIKKNGGYSLELVDYKLPCALSANWRASNSVTGGTPGKENSVFEISKVNYHPSVQSVFLPEPDKVIIHLNQGIDSASAILQTHFNIQPNLQVSNVELKPPFFDQIQLKLFTIAKPEQLYSLYLKGLKDCEGKLLSFDPVPFGITSDAKHNDIVINEILFHPKKDGFDYVELYNKSEKLIDLGKLFLSNRNSAGALAQTQQIGIKNRILFPKEYLLLTTNKQTVQTQYFCPDTKAFIEIPSFPSYPNEKGTVVITNEIGMVIDEVNYSEKWHYPLIKDPQGVSLERIQFDGPSDQSNFHSASSSVGYGTPGYKNSQASDGSADKDDVQITPKTFTPDHDGIDDFLTIQYSFLRQGTVVNIKIFDASGNLVRHLEKNALCGTSGKFYWDGLDENRQQLPQGIYLIHIESFHPSGTKKIFKKTSVLGRRQ